MTEADHFGKNQSTYSSESPPDSPTLEALRALPAKKIPWYCSFSVFLLFLIPVFSLQAYEDIPSPNWLRNLILCSGIAYLGIVFMLYRIWRVAMTAEGAKERFPLLAISRFWFIAAFFIPGVNLVWLIMTIVLLADGTNRVYAEVGKPEGKIRSNQHKAAMVLSMLFILVVFVASVKFLRYAENAPTALADRAYIDCTGSLRINYVSPSRFERTMDRSMGIAKIVPVVFLVMFGVVSYLLGEAATAYFLVYGLLGCLSWFPLLLLIASDTTRMEVALIGGILLLLQFVFSIASQKRLVEKIAERVADSESSQSPFLAVPGKEAGYSS